MSAMTREERLWQKLVDEAGEELIEEAAAVSVAQAEKELAAAGFDVAAERARAEAFLVSLETAVAEEGVAEAVAQEAPASQAKRVGKGARKKGYPAAVWVAAAAAAVAAGAAVTYVATRPEEARIVPTPPPSTRSTGPAVPSTKVATAANLRHRAAAACEKGDADECISLLDLAAESDPAGDTTPEVQQLRKKAAAIPAKPR
jgi:hypothetical protein